MRDALSHPRIDAALEDDVLIDLQKARDRLNDAATGFAATIDRKTTKEMLDALGAARVPATPADTG